MSQQYHSSSNGGRGDLESDQTVSRGRSPGVRRRTFCSTLVTENVQRLHFGSATSSSRGGTLGRQQRGVPRAASRTVVTQYIADYDFMTSEEYSFNVTLRAEHQPAPSVLPKYSSGSWKTLTCLFMAGPQEKSVQNTCHCFTVGLCLGLGLSHTYYSTRNPTLNMIMASPLGTFALMRSSLLRPSLYRNSCTSEVQREGILRDIGVEEERCRPREL